MKTEGEIRELRLTLITLENVPAWFINKPDLETVQKTLLWILDD